MFHFNTREIATAVWFLIFFVFVTSKKSDILRPVRYVVRAFCQLKILISFFVMLLYVAISVFILSKINLWTVDLLKDTIVWFCVSAMVMTVRFVTSDETKNIFKTIIIDNLKIIIIFEFIANTYTFSLPVELIIVSGITIFVLIEAAAGVDKKNEIVEKYAKAILGIFGIIIFIVSMKNAIGDIQNLNKADAWRNIALAPLLSVILSPFIYVLVLYASYELVFLRLNFGVDKAKKLKRYARYRILMYAGLNLRRLEYILKNHALDLMRLQTESDVDMLVQKTTS